MFFNVGFDDAILVKTSCGCASANNLKHLVYINMFTFFKTDFYSTFFSAPVSDIQMPSKAWLAKTRGL